MHIMHQNNAERKEKTMTNTELLEEKIKQSGKKLTYLAEKIGLSYAGFRNCITNKAEFKASHIDILCKELNINVSEMKRIFFANRGA